MIFYTNKQVNIIITNKKKYFFLISTIDCPVLELIGTVAVVMAVPGGVMMGGGVGCVVIGSQG